MGPAAGRFARVFAVVQPAMWLLRVELRAVHEYEADEQVLRCGVDAKDYQMLLIKKAVGGGGTQLPTALIIVTLKTELP